MFVHIHRCTHSPVRVNEAETLPEINRVSVKKGATSLCLCTFTGAGKERTAPNHLSSTLLLSTLSFSHTLNKYIKHTDSCTSLQSPLMHISVMCTLYTCTHPPPHTHPPTTHTHTHIHTHANMHKHIITHMCTHTHMHVYQCREECVMPLSGGKF